MGYTRLMLLALAVVIVLIAVVVGLGLFQKGMTTSNYDELLRDSIAIASRAQAWKSTPQMMGGSPDSKKPIPTDFSGATFTEIGYSTNRLPRCYSNANGDFAITPTDSGLRVTGTNIATQNRVVLLVRGTNDGYVFVQDGPLTSQKAVKGGYYVESGAKTKVFKPVECSGRIAATVSPQ